jgi:hypothetical protein
LNAKLQTNRSGGGYRRDKQKLKLKLKIATSPFYSFFPVPGLRVAMSHEAVNAGGKSFSFSIQRNRSSAQSPGSNHREW